jgi:hypothetical protein
MNFVDSLASAPWDPLEETEWNDSQDASYQPLVTLPNRRLEDDVVLDNTRAGVDLVRSQRLSRPGMSTPDLPRK